MFAEQITPVTVPRPRGAPAQLIEGTSNFARRPRLEALAKLKPVVRTGGTVTAGNASTINDGAAALLLASGAAVEKYGLKARARVLGFATGRSRAAHHGRGSDAGGRQSSRPVCVSRFPISM